MAELRHATRAFLSEGHPPATVLDRLNQLLLRLIPDEIATLCLIDIEPATGAARLANAGHPPPLLIAADGGTRFITEHTPLLGLEGPTAVETAFSIEPGAVLVLFTDGLVERRGQAIDETMAELAEHAGTVEESLDQFCDRLLAEVGPAEPDDDIAIVALRRL